jgi:hexosaminidase
MNTLHWHAVDADSFPLEMAQFPELAEKGAFSSKGHYTIAQQRDVVTQS